MIIAFVQFTFGLRHKMNRTDIFSPLRQLFNTTKNLFSNSRTTETLNSQMSSKDCKENINDVTRDSEDQPIDTSLIISQPEPMEEEPLCQRKIRKILSHKKVFMQKSHQNIVYFDLHGNEINNKDGQAQYQLQQKRSKKRAIPFSQIDFSNSQNSFLKQYDFSTSQQRVDRLDEILLANSQQTRKLRKIEEKNQKIDWTVSKVIIRQKGYCQNQRKISDNDLPNLRNFSINYDSSALYNMTVQQIKKMENVILFNSIGMIEFLEPISLFQVDLNDCLEINKRTFKLKYFEWRRAKFQITIFKQLSKDIELLEIFTQNAAELGLTNKKFNKFDESITFTQFYLK